MKKLFINPKGTVVLKEVRKPSIETKGSIVKTSYALISSGTELAMIRGNKFDSLPLIKRFIKSKDFRKEIKKKINNKNFKSIFKLYRSYSKRGTNKNFVSPSVSLKPLGYSCSGIIQETNSDNFTINEKVACAGSNHAEIIYSPKNLTCKIPENVSLEEASFATLGAIALHGIHRADIKPGEFVGIIGTGLIGLLAIQLAKVSGAITVAFDLINKKLNLAKRLGADMIINPLDHNSRIKVNELTKGYGLDSIIICASSESPKPLEDAVELIRDKGKIVILGGIPISINRAKLYMKEADLLISRSYGPGRYDLYYEYEGFDYPEEYVPWTEQRNMEKFLKLISEKKINVKSLISDIIPVERVNYAYSKLENDPNNNIAILLRFPKAPETKELIQENQVKEREKKKLTIGLIGCGAFAQGVHLPYLLTNPNCRIKGICTQHEKTAEFCKEKYHPEFVTTSYKRILKDPEINTVFIYTRHNTHEKLTIKALNAGKNVYVEKPMAITIEQCKNVYNKVKKTQKLYIIGFNRRYSPLVKIAKELLKERNNPIIINYRIASNFLPGGHWVFNPEIGGGPIIGEFCHFTDLILYLMNSEPVELIAIGGSLSHKGLETYDSCTVIIKFRNNSIANLVYTDLSGSDIPKERIEIFSGESGIIIDDFIKMQTTGFDVGNKVLYEQNKGHKNEIESVINTNLGIESPLVNEDDAFKAMMLCFKTIESIKINKKVKISNDFYE